MRVIFALLLLCQVSANTYLYAFEGGAKIGLTEEENAWLAAHPVIRIGESSEFEPELIRNPDGTFDGTLPEFTRLLEKRLGIRVEIVDDIWPEIFRRIKEKDIDAIGLMNRGVAEKMGLLTIEAPYNVLVTAFARKDRSFRISRDKDVEGLRVAFFREIVFLRKYFAALQGKVEPVEADSPLDAFKMILDKKADLMVGFNEDSYLLQKHSIREIEPVHTFKTLVSNTGTAVRSDAPLLASILAKAFNSISHEERDKILTKWTWMPEKDESTLALSNEEKAWLENHPVLKLGYDVDWLPIERVDKDGRYIGLAADFLSLLEKKLGINIEPVEPGDWNSMLDRARKGELDLLSAVVKTPRRDEFLDFTEPYLSFPMVIVTGEEVTYIREMSELNGKKVGVVSGYASQDHLAANYPEIDIVPVGDVREGLLDVVHGRSFAFIDSLASISHIIEHEGVTDIKISGETPYRFDLRIGVRKGEAVLLSIMQKGLDSISEKERGDIYNRWINIVYEQKLDYKFLWQILAAVFIVLAAIIYWNRRLADEIKQRQQAEELMRKAHAASQNIMQDLYYEIEERKTVEAQMRRLTVAVEQNPAAIVITDLDGNIEYVNPQFARSTGYSDREVIGQKPSILKSGHQPDAYYKKLWETITSGRTWRGDFLNRKKDGELFWESSSISPIKDEDGRIINFIAIKLDITARKEAEEALKRSEASLAMAQKIAHMGNWEWNVKDDELFWSDEIYRIFGIEKESFKATYEAFVGFIHPEDRAGLEEAVQEALGGNGIYSIDHRIVLSDGSEKVVHEEGEVEFDNDRSPVRMLGTVHDITERKKIEEALQIAKEEAEDATRLKDKFVALVSHDLKSPLQRTMGYVELIEEGEKLSDEGKDMVGEVIRACDEMTSLIDEILKLSRIKRGKIMPDYAFVSLHEITMQAIKNYYPLAADKEVTLINETPETGWIYADEKLMLEVLRNLVSNAIKFCKKGDRVRLYIPHGEPSSIAVSDTGQGIASDDLSSLFSYEKKTSTIGTAGESGTGFGLPLSHDIVAAHGGTLELESREGEGTTFYVRLPDVRPKVIIAGDSEAAFQEFRDRLADENVEIIPAESMESAIRLIEKSRPQLIFIDLHMPGTSGLDLLEYVNRDPDIKKIPLVVVIADKTMDVLDKAFQKGADDCLVRPFEKAVLIELLSRFIA